MKLGITFSHQHASFLKLDPINSLSTLSGLPFDIIRLGIYWNEIQPKQNIFDFSKVKALLDICESQKKEVVLTLGMKAPRWPEFYLPQWIDEKKKTEAILNHISVCVKNLGNYSSIKYWQVENEPFDPSGPEDTIVPPELLNKEVELVRSIDLQRKIIINLWGNDMIKRNTIAYAAPLADIIGIDLYYRQYTKTFLGRSQYRKPQSSEKTILHAVKHYNKPLWITELQAEPWEASMDKNGYFSENPKSISPQLIENNFELACKCHPEAILFWGAEYWLWREKQGDNSYIESVKKLLR